MDVILERFHRCHICKHMEMTYTALMYECRHKMSTFGPSALDLGNVISVI